MLNISRAPARRSAMRRRSLCEGLERRVLLSTNAWKAAVSGNWNDATKWSLGHVPLATEDVTITVAGSYTVTVPSPISNSFSVNSLKVGGATGTQTLAINSTLHVAKAFGVGAGDAINLTNGRLLSLAPAGTNDQIDGTITLSDTAVQQSILGVGSANLVGAGSIFFATGGPSSTSENNLEGSTFSLGAGLTLHGKGGAITGTFTNKGTIKIEGGATDVWYFNTFANQGTVTSASGAQVQIYGLNNAAGHTMSFTGGTVLFRGNTFTNAGTINATNAKLTYGMTFTSAGTVHRTNSPVFFAGALNGQNHPFVTSDAAGAWTWTGGTLEMGTYDPTAAGAMKIDLTAPQGTSGSLQQVTLAGDLNIPAGFTVSCSSGTITLATGKRIILNGTATAHAQFTMFGATLAGSGEIVFNTAGNITANVVGGNTYTLGGGIVVHGKSGFITGGATNNGAIISDTAGQTIQLQSVTNNGEIIAAPGTIVVVGTFKQNSGGAMTAGIGGTSPGSTLGVFHFNDTISAAALGGTFNAVLLGGFLPAAGATFSVASFTKPPTGTFATKNLDAGNGKAFDLTQTTTAISLKAKASTNTFASRTAAGALTVTGTAAADTISINQQVLGILFATMNGKSSVFFDRQLVSETINALAGNDKVTVSGTRAAAINGGDGNDSLTGGGGNDSLNGGNGNDSLAGGNGNDVLTGAAGNDTELGGSGNDRYVFGPATAAEIDLVAETTNNGTDTLDFSGLTTAVTVKLNSDTLATMTNRTVKTQTAGQFANLENVVGGSGNDSITGNAAANSILGGAGNDTFFVQDGTTNKDSVDGGAGTDVVSSKDAVDVIVNVP